MTTTPPQLHHRGRPVPYVTKWTAENVPASSLNFQVSVTPTGPWLAYREATAYDRDHRGVLWFRDGAARGQGEPMWSTVHTGRQRRAMLLNLCQVCGRKLPPTEIPWLIPAAEWVQVIRPQVRPSPLPSTANPPCCLDCQPIARSLCPELRRNGVVQLTVAASEPDGVTGEAYGLDGEPRPGWIRYADPSATRVLRSFMAKQQSVTLHGLRVVAQ